MAVYPLWRNYEYFSPLPSPFLPQRHVTYSLIRPSGAIARRKYNISVSCTHKQLHLGFQTCFLTHTFAKHAEITISLVFLYKTNLNYNSSAIQLYALYQLVGMMYFIIKQILYILFFDKIERDFIPLINEHRLSSSIITTM